MPVSVTYTERLNLPQWSAGSDPFNRAQMNAAFADLESRSALDAQGTIAARPAADLRGFYYWATDETVLYRDTGTAWVALPSLTKDGQAWTGTQSIVNIGAPQLTLDSADASHDAQLTVTRRTNAGGTTWRQLRAVATANRAYLQGVSDTPGGSYNNELSFRDGRWGLNWGADSQPSDLLIIKERSGTEVARFTETGRFGVGLTPDYPLDVRHASVARPTFRVGGPSGAGHDNAMFVTPLGAASAVLTFGCLYDSTSSPVSIAKAGSASQFEAVNDSFNWYGNSGLTFDAAYTRTKRMALDGSNGNLAAIGSNSKFGTGALGASGAYLKVGDQGDPNTGYLIADGSGTNVALTHRSKGTGYINFETGAGALLVRIDPTLGTLQVGSGVNMANSKQGAIGISNLGSSITANPSGGGYLYAENGQLKWRGSSGTVTTIANA